MPPPDCVKSTKGLFEWLSHSTCSAFRHSDCPNTAVCLLLHNLSGWPRGRCFMVFRRVPQIHHSQCDIFVSRRVVKLSRGTLPEKKSTQQQSIESPLSKVNPVLGGRSSKGKSGGVLILFQLARLGDVAEGCKREVSNQTANKLVGVYPSWQISTLRRNMRR